MVSNAYIPSLVAFGDVVPNGTKMVPNLVWLIFSLSSTTFSCNIFWLDEHRKTFISKSADFVIFSDITNKMADASDILYTSTALICIMPEIFRTSFNYWDERDAAAKCKHKQRSETRLVVIANQKSRKLTIQKVLQRL